MASEIPSGTPGLRAFTGGLLMVMTATSSCFVNCTRSFISMASLRQRSEQFFAAENRSLSHASYRYKGNPGSYDQSGKTVNDRVPASIRSSASHRLLFLCALCCYKLKLLKA